MEEVKDTQAPSVQEFEEKIANVLSDTLSKSLPEAVAAAVDAKMNELGMTKEDAKKGNIPPSFLGKTQEEVDEMDKHQKAALFVKAVYRKDIATLTAMKALNEGTDSDGGFLVPEEYAAEINRIAEDFGLIRKLARKVSMGRDTYNLPTLSSSVSVSFPGEGAAGTASQPALGNVKLQAKTCVGLTVMSNELLADANVDIAGVLAELFAEALAGEEDNQGLRGTGVPFTGLLEHADVNVVDMAATKTAFTDVTSADLRDLVSQIKVLALPGAHYIMHREIWGTVQKLEDSAGNPLVSHALPIIGPNGATGGQGISPAGFIWGYPVYLSDKMPGTADSAVSTKFIAFGNLKHVWFGNREGLKLSVSDAATVGTNNVFEENQSALRVTERFGLAVGLPTAFAVLKTAAS